MLLRCDAFTRSRTMAYVPTSLRNNRVDVFVSVIQCWRQETWVKEA